MKMMNDTKEYFSRGPREDSVFGKKVLKLVKCCWINPSAKIECIPAKLQRVDVAMYHVYHKNFDVKDLKLTIKAAPMTEVLRTDNGTRWTVCSTKPFPKKEGKP